MTQQYIVYTVTVGDIIDVFYTDQTIAEFMEIYKIGGHPGYIKLVAIVNSEQPPKTLDQDGKLVDIKYDEIQ